jgi:4-hydroxybenzoyl-CoA thioesterase
MRGFTGRYPLRFAHCDPAGIAYYPRYFEICDAAIEDWTDAVIGTPRRVMHLEMGLGMPTVTLAAEFAAVSRLGDLLDIAIAVTEVGRSSVSFRADVSCGGEPRFAVRYKQVLMNLAEARALPWPDEWKARLLASSEANR